MTLVHGEREGIAALWTWFDEEIERQDALSTGTGCYGIAHYPEDWQVRGYTYLAAVEIADASRLGAGWFRGAFRFWRLPALFTEAAMKPSG
jgi:hypothetical protein